jgi:uncharacterized protein
MVEKMPESKDQESDEMTLLKAVHDSGIPLPMENVIHLFEGGSALHGARLAAKSDLDICGVFIEPKIHLYGLDKFEHFVTSTSDQHERNSENDVDITLYSLRRWAFLATKGNPTAISFLFAMSVLDNDHDWVWYDFKADLKRSLIAKSAAKHYRGFVDGQMKRLLGEKGQGKHGQRPELTASHGYDTKAAMHAVRLVGEGIELMTKGFITYPRHDKGHLIDIRLGKYSLDSICHQVSGFLHELDYAVEHSSLRDTPDRVAINQALVDAYEAFYTFYEETE